MTKKEHKPKEVSLVEVHDVSPHILSKRNLLIFSCLLALVLISVGWLLLYNNVPSPKKTSKSSAANVVRDAGVVTKDDIGSLEKKVSQTTISQTESAQNYAALGSAYAINNQTDKAFAAYSKSLTLSPNNVLALTGLVYLYVNSGKNQQAIDTLNQMIAISKKSSDGFTQADAQKYQVQVDRLKQGLEL